MSPQYSRPSLYSTSSVALMKARNKTSQQDDPRIPDLDRMLAVAYLRMRKQMIQQKRAGVFTPRMDLCDDPESPFLIAVLEVPGMKADHLSVRIENGLLIVEGERQGPRLHTSSGVSNASSMLSEPTAVPESESTNLYPIRELKYGKFRRTIDLPLGVSAVHVRSTLVEGMLTITWPRNPASLVDQSAADLLDTSPRDYVSSGV